jgi:hypothetical protein
MMTTSTDQVLLPFRFLLLQSPHVITINYQISSLETFEATEFNEMFSGRQQCQNVKLFDVSGTNSLHIFRVCW